MARTDAVAKAIVEIERCVAPATVTVVDDPDGGASVIVEDIPLGGPWAERTTWIGFRITYTYPYSDVYPHFVRHDLTRTDGTTAMGEAMSLANFEGREAIQISRVSNKRDPTRETAALKLLKVMTWLRTRQ
jgi:hypothetical protein